MSIFSIDVGTTAIKAAIIDKEGKVLAHDVFKIDEKKELFTQLKTGFCFLWNNCTAKTINFSSINSIEGICISGNGPSLVRFSKEDKAIDYILWNTDFKPTTFQEEILKNSKSLFISRIFALQNKQPFNLSETLLGIPEYLTFLLTGTKATILPEEKFKTAYWSNELLIQAKIPHEILPHFVKPGTFAGYTYVSLNEKTFLSNNNSFFFDSKNKNTKDIKLPVFFGAPDFVSALIGTNTLEEGKVCDRAGSSEGINLCVSSTFDFKAKDCFSDLRILPSIIPELWNISYLISDSGIVLQKYGNDSIKAKEIEKKLILGFTELNKFHAIKTMAISGGQAKNIEWLQKKANFLKTKIEIPECIDSELLGNAILTYSFLNKKSSIKEIANKMYRIKKIIYPENAK